MKTDKQNKDIENNPDAIETNDEFKTPNSSELTSDEILSYQQRINMQRCSPLGESGGDSTSMSEEVEKGVMNENKPKSKEQ